MCGFRLGPHPPPITREKVRVGRSRTPTAGRAGFRHVILSPWAAGLGGANAVREAPPGSVAAVGRGETKQPQPLPPALPPSLLLLPAQEAPTSTATTNFGTVFSPAPKKSRWGGAPQKPRTERQSLKTRRASCLPAFFSACSPAYLAQEVDIVEGGQKCGRHVSGSCNGPSCRLGGPEEPSERRSRTGATTNNGRGAGGWDQKLAGSEQGGRGKKRGLVRGCPGVRRGGKGEKQRALLRAPGCPARPPARSRRQLADCWNSGAGELAPYIAACRGRGQLTPPGSPGNRLPAGQQTSGAFPAAHWPPPIFFFLGRGQASGRGRLRRRPGWLGSWAQMGAAAGRWGDTASRPWGRTVEKPQHVSRGRGFAVPDGPFPARSC